MSTRPLWTFSFVTSHHLESIQQCSPPWELPDPSPGTSSSQPLKCLPQEDSLILFWSPLAVPFILWGSCVGAPHILALSESPLAWRDVAGKAQCMLRLCCLS